MLVVKGTGQPVHMSSADFIIDPDTGEMVAANAADFEDVASPDGRSLKAGFDANTASKPAHLVVKTGSIKEEHKLSSAVPNKYLRDEYTCK